MHAFPPEISLDAPGEGPLLDRLRDALAAEGPRPSRPRAAAWITGGLVRVDGTPVTDPAAVVCAGARLDLVPGEASERADRSGEAGRAAPLPILHLDRHLLVVEVPPGTRGAADLARALSACLDAAGWVGRRPVPAILPPFPPGASGLVAAALSREARDRLAPRLAAPDARVEVLARVEAVPVDADGEVLAADASGAVLRIRAGAEGAEGVRRRLERRGVGPQPLPAAAGGGLALHVLGLRFRHPRTDRALAWTADPPPWLPPDAP